MPANSGDGRRPEGALNGLTTTRRKNAARRLLRRRPAFTTSGKITQMERPPGGYPAVSKGGSLQIWPEASKARSASGFYVSQHVSRGLRFFNSPLWGMARGGPDQCLRLRLYSRARRLLVQDSTRSLVRVAGVRVKNAPWCVVNPCRLRLTPVSAIFWLIRPGMAQAASKSMGTGGHCSPGLLYCPPHPPSSSLRSIRVIASRV